MLFRSGDTWGAFEPGVDMLRYGHKAPWKDDRDRRVNDMFAHLNPAEMWDPGNTQRGLSKLTSGKSDVVLRKWFPYRDRPPAPKPEAPKERVAPQRPTGPAPQQPGSIREIGEQARGQSKAVRSPEDYLGSAFDATLRKGIATGRNYLQNQMNKDGLDSEQQSKIMARFNDKIAGDKELSKKENEGGVINTIKAKDEARAGRTLEAYRGQRGAYEGNTSYADMQKKYVK